MLRLESSWHGRSLDHVLTYSGRQIAVGSQRPSRITRQKTCCISQSNTPVRVVFANGSGSDAPIGVVLAWEERGSCLNIFWTTNHGCISETFTNYAAKDLLRKNLHQLRGKRLVAQVSQTRRFANRSGFDAPIGVILAREERRSCLNIFRTTNRSRISETFTNYEAKELLCKNLHELRGKTLAAQVSRTRRFANQSGFDAPIGVILARKERRSCLNIFRTTNRSRISETYTNYEAKDLLRKSVDKVLTYSGRQIAVGSQKPSRITRQKTRCASESNTSVRVVFANRSGFDAPIGVVLAWEERGSLSQTPWLALYSRTGVVLMLRLESSWHGRSVDHDLTYSGRQIVVGSQKPSRIIRQKICCASESNTSVRVVFANRSGFDAPIGVVLAWEERGSCINLFRMTNRGRISEIFTSYEAKDLLHKSVEYVLTYSGRQIAVGSQKPSRITRQKTCCTSESNSSVRVVFANRSGFDAPVGVVLAWEKGGSCLNIFWTTNHGRISETFTNYAAKDLLHKSVDHVLTYSVRQIAVGSQKPSRITRQKTRCASETNTSVRIVFAYRSGFDAPIGVVLAWELHG
ncbi:uncharacterized protein G2W53_009816 [Senna tora]|uniref:Uncharacterized protein n=1 Tax=Senna tora TaxID=362788 RepID=A0A834WZJ4_9FABA|nr:uncharacterized protein G2W53_009816 [Senna tora]